jgi:hypothetical protein
MLHREKVLMALMEAAGGAASRAQLLQWAFLLSHECPSGGGSAFYDFLGYGAGPYSFCLCREIGTLTDGRFIEETAEAVWKLLPRGRKAAEETDPHVWKDIRALLRDHRRTAESADGCGRYRSPSTRNGRRRADAPATRVAGAVNSAGYEGLSVDGFLNGLLVAGIERLIDVRNNPVSRRFGFHRSTLDRLCGLLGIEYYHFPDLGIPPALRRDLTTEQDYENLFEAYERDVLDSRPPSFGTVAGLAAGKPSALVCVETDPRRCHRSRLADRLAKATGMPVNHLEILA